MPLTIETIKKKITTLVASQIMCGKANKNKLKKIILSKKKNMPIFLIIKTFHQPERKRHYSVIRKGGRGHRKSVET